MQSARFVIYTRGLAKSPAWKMAEYLSQGKIIIAERLTAELPEPLLDGVHLFYADNDAHLITIAKELIENPGKFDLDRISKNARAYYENNISPSKNVERMLQLALHHA